MYFSLKFKKSYGFHTELEMILLKFKYSLIVHEKTLISMM